MMQIDKLHDKLEKQSRIVYFYPHSGIGVRTPTFTLVGFYFWLGSSLSKELI